MRDTHFNLTVGSFQIERNKPALAYSDNTANTGRRGGIVTLVVPFFIEGWDNVDGNHRYQLPRYAREGKIIGNKGDIYKLGPNDWFKNPDQFIKDPTSYIKGLPLIVV